MTSGGSRSRLPTPHAACAPSAQTSRSPDGSGRVRRLLHLIIAFVLALCSASAARAQLTEAQRQADLGQLIGLFDKNYGPYEWKRDVLGFDLLNAKPWEHGARKANDLDFQELLISYLASLNDAHTFIEFNSDFSAELPLTVDIYDDRILIDSLFRPALPIGQYPFTIGDELLSMDGYPARALVGAFGRYTVAGNRTSTDRLAANLLTRRAQFFMPKAHVIGDTATIEVLMAATGRKGTFQIPWSKTGTPVTFAGPVPNVGNPGREPHRRFPRRFAGIQDETPRAGMPQSAARQWQGVEPEVPKAHQLRRQPSFDDTLPDYFDALRPLVEASVPDDRSGVLGFGSRFPIFSPPPGFVQRLGGTANDFFLSGTYVSGGIRIGYLRIPSMSPPSTATALRLLDGEIAFFNAFTDGLIVDLMRNPGGSIVFADSIAQRLIPVPFKTNGFELRATAFWLASIDRAVTSAKLGGAPPEIVQNLERIFEEIKRAFAQNRGRTAPVSLNPTGSLTLQPAAVAYKKPLMVLVDGMSASAADMLAAILQDARRGPLLGTRTMGAGGNVVTRNATAYSEGTALVTLSLANRGVTIVTDDYPPTPYIENVGVRPDVNVDYMTRENLLSGGQPFVQAFTQSIVKLVQTGSPK